MPYTRRTFLTTSAAAASVAAVSSLTPRPLMAFIGGRPESVPPIQDPRLKELVQQALDAAKSAGATYADVRLTHTFIRGISGIPVSFLGDGENMSVGVRALVNGYWGFASSPIWSPDEMARLGRVAVAQAKTNDLTHERTVDLAPMPVVQDGHWETPIEIDPFSIYPVELRDYLESLNLFLSRFRGVIPNMNSCTMTVQDKAFGSTEGSYCTQRCFDTQGTFSVVVMDGRTQEQLRGSLDTLTPTGVGFELYKGQPILDNIRKLIDDLRADLALPVKSIDPSRYVTVLDEASMARLISTTIGRASELDRALGYEANSGGTSYLNDPGTMLGSFQVGNSMLSVSANRDEKGGAATVQWDDDGVHPEQFPLVTNGIVQGYQTVRESAGWLRDRRNGAAAAASGAFRSHGCAYARDASFAPLTHTANLTLKPGTGTASFESMIAAMDKGVAIRDLDVDLDFQQLNGFCMGTTYEITKGKRTAILANAGILFRTPEFWKSLSELGGPASARRFGQRASKGEPRQDSYHSATAVPALFKEQTVIDVLRKA